MALAAAIRFDPDRATTTYGSNGGKHFDSWICDVMWHRCTDWLRKKSEGGGDSRYGFANRVVLTDEFDEDSEPEFEIERFISADRVSEWKAAANLVGLPLEEFVVITLDRAAEAIKRAAKTG
jgi:DNA-directed RNA polymerase specialized sigma24 family protein